MKGFKVVKLRFIFPMTLLIVLVCVYFVHSISDPAPTDYVFASDDPERYTIVWMTDTQYYSARYPETFKSMTECR